MTSISNNVHVDKLNDIGSKYNNTYHSTINMKPVDVKPNTYIDSSKETNDKNQNPCSEEVSVIKKVRNTVSWAYVISDLKGEEIVGTFWEKELP